MGRLKMWNLAIRRPVTFTMLFLSIIGIGIVSLLRLLPELMPDVEMPLAGVIATYPGVGPEDIEKLVPILFEGAVAPVTNVEIKFQNPNTKLQTNSKS